MRQTFLFSLACYLPIFLFVNIQSIIKHQILYSTFQCAYVGASITFIETKPRLFHNDFAGRLSAKVMQTALAVREFWIILGDMLAYVSIYFITVSIVLGAISPTLLIPLMVWLGLFLLSAWFFIPRLSKVSQQQADTRCNDWSCN